MVWSSNLEFCCLQYDFIFFQFLPTWWKQIAQVEVVIIDQDPSKFQPDSLAGFVPYFIKILYLESLQKLAELFGGIRVDFHFSTSFFILIF